VDAFLVDHPSIMRAAAGRGQSIAPDVGVCLSGAATAPCPRRTRVSRDVTFWSRCGPASRAMEETVSSPENEETR
jgi:hypothetical protein